MFFVLSVYVKIGNDIDLYIWLPHFLILYLQNNVPCAECYGKMILNRIHLFFMHFVIGSTLLLAVRIETMHFMFVKPFLLYGN